MLLRLAIIDSRETYLRRLVDAFGAEYADRLEVIAFTTLQGFEDYLKTDAVDVMLVGSELADETIVGKRGATLVYLVDDKSIESVYGHRAICRFQKTDLLYKGILDACSDRFDHVKSRRSVVGDANVMVFFPASGGAGASSMAAACALAAARRGLRPFYLNLELLGVSQTYFQALGAYGLDDVLVAVRKKHNIGVRLQSAVKQTAQGVSFLDSCTNPLDIVDLSAEHLELLVREIALSDAYDVIVLDMDYPHSKLAAAAMDLAARVVFVSNGTPVSNAKFERLYQMLQSQSRSGTWGNLGKVALAYNNFNSKTGRRLASDMVPMAGGLPRVVDASGNAVGGAQLADALSAHKLFDVLLDGVRRDAAQQGGRSQGAAAFGLQAPGVKGAYAAAPDLGGFAVPQVQRPVVAPASNGAPFAIPPAGAQGPVSGRR